MTETEIAAEIDRQAAAKFDRRDSLNGIARPVACTCRGFLHWCGPCLASGFAHGAPQPAQSMANPMTPQDTLSRICGQALGQRQTYNGRIRPDACTCRGKPDWCAVCVSSGFAFGEPTLRCDAPPVPDRIAELEAQLAAMTRERDYALLRMEVAIATSHAWIDAEVRRRSQLLGIPEHMAPAFPASALRHQSQPIGLLSTADAGRVRLGGYAPSLPSPTPRRCPK